MAIFKNSDRQSAPHTDDPAQASGRVMGAENEAVAVLTPDAARQAQRDGARLIDVRETDEWASGHVADARHHPIATVEAEPQLDISPETPVITYCAAGGRAARAAAALAAHGYTNVSAMSGGYEDWRSAGYPVDKPPDDSTP